MTGVFLGVHRVNGGSNVYRMDILKEHWHVDRYYTARKASREVSNSCNGYLFMKKS